MPPRLRPFFMKRLPVMAWLAATAALLFSPEAEAQSRAAYEKMVAVHAQANRVPEALVHRVIVRESKYHPDLIGRGGTIGLMQIKLATARGLGYTGDAEGLRDPETNLTYGVKYLAGAYRAAESNHDRAVHLYASGYYEVAKRQRLERARHPETLLASAPPKEPDTATKEATAAPPEPPAATENPEQAAVEPMPAAKPEAAKPKSVTVPKNTLTGISRPKTPPKTAFKPIDLIPSFLKPKPVSKGHSKRAAKKLADAKERVPRPPAGMPASTSSGANAAKPR
jgi:transglycosylase-like protein with SLT domain